MKDGNGNSLSFSYNNLQELTTVHDTLGRPITYTYNTDTRLLSVTDFNGRTVSLSYYGARNISGSANDISSVTVTSSGQTHTENLSYYTVNGLNNLETITDGTESKYISYDGGNRVINKSYSNINMNPLQYSYAFSGTSISTGTVINANSIQTIYTFDTNGNITGSSISRYTGGSAIYSYRYDANTLRLTNIVYPPKTNSSSTVYP